MADSDKLSTLLKSAESVVRVGAARRANGAVASLRTQEYSWQVVSESCRRLHQLGFLLQDVSGLTRKHVDALVVSWHQQGMSNKTIQNQFSRLKLFCGWLDKPWLVSPEGAAGHLPTVDPQSLRVRTVADHSKSLSAHGLDVGELIGRARQEDERFGAMMLLGVAFGLRKKELLRVKPWRADKGGSLDIDGSVAKNGRFRSITLEPGRCGEAQRAALDHAKSVCRKYDTLGWPSKTFKQNENRYYYFMKRVGLTLEAAGCTGHGLRAEYAENILLLNNLTPPTLGGSARQMPKSSRDEILTGVQHKMGHGDLHVASAYYGTFRSGQPVDGLGSRIGPILIVNDEKEIFATLFCNPPAQRLADGRYKQRSPSERDATQITVLVEQTDQGESKVPLVDFIREHAHLTGRIERVLQAAGLLESVS